MTDLTQTLLGRMADAARRFDALSEQMASPEVLADPRELQRLGREQAALAEPVAQYRELLRVRDELAATRALLESEADDDLRALAREEIDRLERRHDELVRALKEFLHPRDPNDNRDVIVEIRAGTGGEEAGLFAADLFRTYVRYAESRGWKVEVLSTSESDLGGLREVIFEVIGRGAYSRLKYESGVHRVQRVPETEAQGRIHTSTATVAVLPEPEELDVTINPGDLRIDVFRSSGHGGQSVNTTDSAVRITHLPSGIVVSIQDEKSQLKNKNRALAVLRARLYERERQRAHAEQDEVRRAQVGTGERAEKIRTYNFPQNRVTDHRINLTLYNLEGVLAGDLDPIIDALVLADEQRSNGSD